MRTTAERADLLERSLVAQACHSLPSVQATLGGLARQPLGSAHGGGSLHSTFEIIEEDVPAVISSFRQKGALFFT
jgi:hypothetical protein